MIPSNLSTILIAKALTDAANVILGFFTGSVDIITDLIFPIISIILYPFYMIIVYIVNAFHQLLIILVTYTPYPKDADGNPVIFAEPASTDSFYSMIQISHNYLEPFAMIIILIGIAIVLFARIFDVAIDSINMGTSEAKERLLIAPFFVLLWVPIANLVLVLASGITDLFLNVEVEFNDEMFENVDIDDDGLLGTGDDGNPELDFVSLMRSLGPSFEGGGYPSGGDTLYSMILAGTFGLISTLIYIIVILMAMLRVLIVYVLYIVGPISIALWAFAWRQFSKLGKDYVKYFILFALFPIPAALINTLLPIMVIAIEDSVMSAVEGGVSASFGGVGGTNPVEAFGYGGLVRAMYPIIAPLAVGIGPWIFAVGVNGAMKAAGVAAGGAAVAATGGAASIGMAAKAGKAASDKSGLSGEMSKIGSAVSGPSEKDKGTLKSYGESIGGKVPKSSKISSAASSAASSAKKSGKKLGRATKDNRREIQEKAAEVSDTVGQSSIPGVSSVGRMSGEMIGNFNDMEESVSDAKGSMRSGVGSIIQSNKDGDAAEDALNAGEGTSENSASDAHDAMYRMEDKAVAREMSEDSAESILKSSELDESTIESMDEEERNLKAHQHARERVKEDGSLDDLRGDAGESATQEWKSIANGMTLDKMFESAEDMPAGERIQSLMRQKDNDLGRLADEMADADGGFTAAMIEQETFAGNSDDANRSDEICRNHYENEDELSAFEKQGMEYEEARSVATDSNAVRKTDLSNNELKQLLADVDELPDSIDDDDYENVNLDEFVNAESVSDISMSPDENGELRSMLNDFLVDSFDQAIDEQSDSLDIGDLQNKDMMEADLLSGKMEDAAEAAMGEEGTVFDGEQAFNEMINMVAEQTGEDVEGAIEEATENVSLDEVINGNTLENIELGESGTSLEQALQEQLNQNIDDPDINVDEILDGLDPFGSEQILFGDGSQEKLKKEISSETNEKISEDLRQVMGTMNMDMEINDMEEISDGDVDNMFNEDQLAEIQAKRFAQRFNEDMNELSERIQGTDIQRKLENDPDIDRSNLDESNGGINIAEAAIDGGMEPQEFVRQFRD